jgi:hypothetical protein
MKTTLSTIFRAVVATFAFSSLLSAAAFAQASPNSAAAGQALEIGPPLINLRGDPGQTLKATLSLRDVSSNKLVVSNEINDFTANDVDGTPKLLLNQTESNPYSIISWITALPQFTLTPKQIQQLNVTVKVPQNAAPGGYYGVIRFTGLPPGVNGTGLGLSASIGALVFVRVNGDAKESVAVSDFSTIGGNGKPNWMFESQPVNFATTLKNGGNLFEGPTGKIVVTDMFGKDIGGILINSDQKNILPGTTRKFPSVLDQSVIGNTFLFGKYTAKLTLNYGENNKSLTSTVTFWVIPYRLIAAVIIGLVVLGLLIRFGLQRYRDSIVNSSRGGGRRR